MGDKPLDLVKCPPEIATAVDNFIELNRSIKQLERKQQHFRNQILDHGKKVRADRIAGGREDSSFKLEGMVEAVTYVCAEDSGNISLMEFENLNKEFGSLARRLVEFDYEKFRFDSEILRENFDSLLAAISKLPNNLGDQIIRPLPLTLRKGWVENLRSVKDTNLIVKILEKFKATVKLQDG